MQISLPIELRARMAQAALDLGCSKLALIRSAISHYLTVYEEARRSGQEMAYQAVATVGPSVPVPDPEPGIVGPGPTTPAIEPTVTVPQPEPTPEPEPEPTPELEPSPEPEQAPTPKRSR